MKHSEIVESVASTLNKPKTVVNAVLAETVKCIVQGVSVNGIATLKDFGTFKRRDRPARKARNPIKGGMIDVPAKSVIGFKAAKSVRDQIA